MIRKAHSGDIDKLLAIEQKAFLHPWSYTQFENELNNTPVTGCNVYEKGKEIIGFIVFHDIGTEVEILIIAVAQAFRRNGIGRELLESIVDNNNQNTDIFLDVKASNYSAIKLYIDAGFKEIGRRTAYYKDGEDAIVMIRKNYIMDAN